jgi:hypothetical protein
VTAGVRGSGLAIVALVGAVMSGCTGEPQSLRTLLKRVASLDDPAARTAAVEQ